MSKEGLQAYAEYLAWWKTALGELLGWSEERVLAWSQQEKEYALASPGLFLHEAPGYYVAWVVLPDQVKLEALGVSIPKFVGRLQVAIENGRGLACYDDENHPWGEVRIRVNLLLAEVREALPDSQRD